MDEGLRYKKMRVFEEAAAGMDPTALPFSKAAF